MRNFIVIEGVCCSGKTTVCKILQEKLTKLSYYVVYNHGAMTYTDLGKEFKKTTETKDIAIATLYYFTDLIINTKCVIAPQVASPKNIILQDRYFDALTTYVKAYGEYSNRDCDIYRIPQVLVENGSLLKPSVKIFCIPPYEVIVSRMEISRETEVHVYYKQNPEFLKMVYNELKKHASRYPDAIIIDTSVDKSIDNGINSVMTLINN